MVQCRRGARFLQESKSVLVGRDFIPPEELDGDQALQPRVLGFVHFAHPALAKLFEDGVTANLRADNRASLGPLEHAPWQPVRATGPSAMTGSGINQCHNRNRGEMQWQSNSAAPHDEEFRPSLENVLNLVRRMQ